MSLIATALNLFAPQIGKVLEKVIPDTGKRDEIEREIRLAMLEQADTFNKQAGQIVLAEANSQHWLVGRVATHPHAHHHCHCCLELSHRWYCHRYWVPRDSTRTPAGTMGSPNARRWWLCRRS